MSQLQNNSSYGPRCNQVNRQAERISRIKSLINRYHALRSETQQLQSQARQTTSSTLKDSGLSSLPAVERSGEWSVYLANSRAPNSTELTLSQLESALHAKWQSLSSFLWNDKALTVVVESQQEIHSSITSGIQAGMAMIKNETLYNLTLESPLLRDADILDGRIMETWRGAPHFPPRYCSMPRALCLEADRRCGDQKGEGSQCDCFSEGKRSFKSIEDCGGEFGEGKDLEGGGLCVEDFGGQCIVISWELRERVHVPAHMHREMRGSDSRIEIFLLSDFTLPLSRTRPLCRSKTAHSQYFLTPNVRASVEVNFLALPL